MVSPPSRWTATPLLILLLSSTTYAQYTLRGRVVQDHHKHALGRRAEPAARPSDSDTDKAGGDGEDPAGPEASSSTQSDKGDEGDTGDGVNAGSDKAPADAAQDGGESNALYLVSHEDFCVYGPSEPNTPVNSIGDNVVSWCTKDHGSKTIPEGTLSGVTYVKTPNYVQVSGYGDFTKINIAAGDKGGQFDSSEHTPSGAQLLLGADKSPASNWVTLIGYDTFCVRACTGDPQYCPTQYYTLGCYFLTNNGVGWPDAFQDCEGEDGDIPGVFDGKTYTVGQGTYPPLVAPSVNCNGGAAAGPAPTGTDHKSAAAHESGNSSAHGSSASSGPSGSGSASSSEEWLPVETCVPCAGAGASSSGGPSSAAGSASAKPSSTAAGSTPALSGTIEVGMSQLQTGGSVAGGASAIAGSPTTAPKAGGDALVQKRQAKSAGGGEADAGGEGDGGEGDASSAEGGEEKSEGGDVKTVTKGDQCCFTTWTQAAGGAKPTGTGAATGTGTGAGKAGATTGPFSGMSVAASSASKAANGSGVAGAGNKTAGAANGTGNGTGNGTESGAESWRGEAFGMDGMGKIVGGLIIGLIGGGWSLV